MPSAKQELIIHNSQKKRKSVKNFAVIPFELDGKKSCRIDIRTVIFIDKEMDCETEKTKYWKTHQTYQSIYDAARLGRKKKHLA